MKQSKKELYKIIEGSKHYPVIGAKRLLNIDLPFYQQDMLERGFYTKFPLYLCSRRTGKTFVVAVLAALKASLYRNMRVGITAPVFRQAQTLFLEIEDIFKRSPYFRSQVIDEPKHGNAAWYINLINGSRIMALPFRDSIRSKGFNIVIIDEYSFGDNMNQKVKRIVEPMIFTKRSIKLDTPIHETDIGNQMIVMSTATFKWNDYYDLVQKYDEKIRTGSKDHDIISYDYRDGIKSGLFEESIVMDKFNEADPLTRQMEYLNVFADSSGGFITYKMLSEKVIDKDESVDENDNYIPPETQIEFKQELDENDNPKYEYILAFDDADSGNDNFAIALIRLDGRTKRIVRILAANRSHIQEKTKIIRDLLRNFNIVKIVGDQRHKNIVDNLAEPYEYSDGKKGPAILLKETEAHKDRAKKQKEYLFNRFGKDVDYEPLIEIHNFSGPSNEIRAKHFFGEIEKGRVKMPAPLSVGSKAEEDAHNEIKKALAEIISIQPKSNGKYVKFEPPSASSKKDRWTVCELGVFMSDEYLKNEFNSNDEDDIVMGVWN